MKIWITRDFDKSLKLHFDTPTLFEDETWVSLGEKEIDFTLFSEVTFENSPQMIELKLVK